MNAHLKSGGELFIVDNSDEHWKGLRYLQDWTEIASGFDIATGFFEIGSLLALDGRWQKLDKIRILMGDEASERTRQVMLDGLKKDITVRLTTAARLKKTRMIFSRALPPSFKRCATERSNVAPTRRRNSTPKPTSLTRAWL